MSCVGGEAVGLFILFYLLSCGDHLQSYVNDVICLYRFYSTSWLKSSVNLFPEIVRKGNRILIHMLLKFILNLVQYLKTTTTCRWDVSRIFHFPYLGSIEQA